MANKMRMIVTTLLACWLTTTTWAQPIATPKRTIGDLEIYPDFKNRNLFYYAPGNLTLAQEQNGKPRFQLLEMRYTGTSATGNQGEKRFANVVQFTVQMEEASREALQQARQQLGGTRIDLRPLPIRDVEAFVVAPVGGQQEKSGYRRIGKDGSFQAESDKGSSGRSSYWTERTFTLKLENHEAQLLWDQVQQDQLALSLGYAFYADLLPAKTGDVEVKHNGDVSEAFEETVTPLLTTDTLPTSSVVRADAFAIRINTKQWPDVLKKIDLNEGVPPAYAALEVRCFDFTEDLRPDLAIKAIDIVATGVGGQQVTLPAQKFLSSEPDLWARQIRFPYAVKLSAPYKYRIVEYTCEGTKQVSEWITAPSWSTHLDITTPAATNAFARREVDLEVPLQDFEAQGISRADVIVRYTFRKKPTATLVTFQAGDELPLKQAIFKYDRDQPVACVIRWTFSDGKTLTGNNPVVGADDYLYFDIPKE
jgi:hypothetical protein